MKRPLWLVLIWVLLGLLPLDSAGQQANITLNDIWKSNALSPEYVSGLRSMNDGKHYTSSVSTSDGMAIVKYAYATGEATDTLYNSAEVKDAEGNPIPFADYSFNPDETKILLATQYEPIYRHSSKAHYFAYDIAKHAVVAITDFSKGKQQLAAFSPTSNAVAFVRDNDLYIANLNTGTERRVTNDGAWGKIINGAVDWVYEEEFAFDKGFQWSPDGERIAYYRFDETAVREYDLILYDSLYPSEYRYKYPKAGERNSTVRIFVYDLDRDRSREVALGANAEQYIPRILWTTDPGKLAVMRMNRHQNHLEFLLADVASRDDSIAVDRFYDEKNDTYIEINDNLKFLEDGKHFVWNSEKSGYNHLYLFGMDGREVGPITKGAWDIVEVYGIDETNRRAYFSAAVEGPLKQGVYSQSYSNLLRGKSVKNAAQPRNLTPTAPHNDAVFSNTFDYFINFASAADTPYRIALFNGKGDIIRQLKTNDALKDKLGRFALSEKEFDQLTTPEGTVLNYWMIKPPNFDPARSYPLMFMIYGGPGKNTVADRWEGRNYLWHQMLAQQGYIVVSVDPRGTMLRGKAFKHATYMQLGKLETEDFIASAKYFGGLDYVNADRIGMMGWSYGGYMSSLCMTKGADVFALGIAVAPVTNWRYYDSIYTERFMRTPQENPHGYDDNSPINFVDKLKGPFLLVHGSADDNVHLQNSMMMITALVAADKQFDLAIYPNKNHGIYGGNTRYHLYTQMTEFIKENL